MTKCIVKSCENTIKTAPRKYFVLVPQHPFIEREKWFNSVGVDLQEWTGNRLRRGESVDYAVCCEDHFNLSDDIAGEACRLRFSCGGVVSHTLLKRGCYPRIVVPENGLNEHVVLLNEFSDDVLLLPSVVSDEKDPLSEDIDSSPATDQKRSDRKNRSSGAKSSNSVVIENPDPYSILTVDDPPVFRSSPPLHCVATIRNAFDQLQSEVAYEPETSYSRNFPTNYTKQCFYPNCSNLKISRSTLSESNSCPVYCCKEHLNKKIVVTSSEINETQPVIEMTVTGADSADTTVEVNAVVSRESNRKIGENPKRKNVSKKKALSINSERRWRLSRLPKCTHNTDQLQCQKLVLSDIMEFDSEYKSLKTNESQDDFIFKHMDRDLTNASNVEEDNLLFFVRKIELNCRIPVCFNTFCRALGLNSAWLLSLASKYFDKQDEEKRFIEPPASPDSPNRADLVDVPFPEETFTTPSVPLNDIDKEQSSPHEIRTKPQANNTPDVLSPPANDVDAIRITPSTSNVNPIRPSTSQTARDSSAERLENPVKTSTEPRTPPGEKGKHTEMTESTKRITKRLYWSYNLCHYCLHLTRWSGEYERHCRRECKRIRLFKKDYPILCKVCVTFEAHSVKELKHHVQVEHKYVCRFCSASYTVLDGFKSHLKDSKCKRFVPPPEKASTPPEIPHVDSLRLMPLKACCITLEKSTGIDKLATKAQAVTESELASDETPNKGISEVEKRKSKSNDTTIKQKKGDSRQGSKRRHSSERIMVRKTKSRRIHSNEKRKSSDSDIVIISTDDNDAEDGIKSIMKTSQSSSSSRKEKRLKKIRDKGKKKEKTSDTVGTPKSGSSEDGRNSAKKMKRVKGKTNALQKKLRSLLKSSNEVSSGKTLDDEDADDPCAGNSSDGSDYQPEEVRDDNLDSDVSTEDWTSEPVELRTAVRVTRAKKEPKVERNLRRMSAGLRPLVVDSENGQDRKSRGGKSEESERKPLRTSIGIKVVSKNRSKVVQSEDEDEKKLKITADDSIPSGSAPCDPPKSSIKREPVVPLLPPIDGGDKKWYICQKCGAIFTTVWGLRTHQRKVERCKTDYLCLPIQVTIKEAKKIRKKLALELKVESGENDPDPVIIKEEASESKEDIEFTNSCETCYKGFTSKKRLFKHQKISKACNPSTMDVLTCPKCPFSVKGEVEFLTHLAKQHGSSDRLKKFDQRNYKCFSCTLIFKKVSHMIRHVHRDHRKQFFCPICDFKIDSFGAFYDHAQKKH